LFGCLLKHFSQIQRSPENAKKAGKVFFGGSEEQKMATIISRKREGTR
jgi:hypothetical protein